jgi:hypothetical protein
MWGVIMDDRIQKRLSDMPDIYRGNYKKAMKGRNRTAAVKAFCLECVGWQRNEVKECSSVECPLYLYRPFK